MKQYILYTKHKCNCKCGCKEYLFQRRWYLNERYICTKEGKKRAIENGKLCVSKSKKFLGADIICKIEKEERR